MPHPEWSVRGVKYSCLPYNFTVILWMAVSNALVYSQISQINRLHKTFVGAVANLALFLDQASCLRLIEITLELFNIRDLCLEWKSVIKLITPSEVLAEMVERPMLQQPWIKLRLLVSIGFFQPKLLEEIPIPHPCLSNNGDNLTYTMVPSHRHKRFRQTEVQDKWLEPLSLTLFFPASSVSVPSPRITSQSSTSKSLTLSIAAKVAQVSHPLMTLQCAASIKMIQV